MNQYYALQSAGAGWKAAKCIVQKYTQTGTAGSLASPSSTFRIKSSARKPSLSKPSSTPLSLAFKAGTYEKANIQLEKLLQAEAIEPSEEENENKERKIHDDLKKLDRLLRQYKQKIEHLETIYKGQLKKQKKDDNTPFKEYDSNFYE